MELIHKRANPRKNLLDFVSEFHKGNLLNNIGSNFDKWIEELVMINHLVARDNVVSSTGRSPNEAALTKIGDNVFLQLNKDTGSIVFWSRKNGEWKEYLISSRAHLSINPEYEFMSDMMLPENFISRSSKIESKRPIFNFKVGDLSVYAKGSEMVNSFYYEYSKPSYRLTSLSGISKVSSKSEAEKTLILMQNSVKVPEMIGYYESDFEEFFFCKKVNGKTPDKFIRTHRNQIIAQDSSMLAEICKLGYRKQGFADFDDKIFDGKNLYLIDVEEMVDLYAYQRIDFRKIVLDCSSESLAQFRKHQKDMFLGALKDAVYCYRKDLLSDDESKKKYIKNFFISMGWSCSEDKMKDLMTFPDNYSTYDSEMSIMMDTG